MGSVYRRGELNTRPGGRKNNGGARSGAGRAALRRRGAARGRRRFRLLVKTPRAFDLSAYLRQWLAAAAKPTWKMKLEVDVDPQSLM